MSDYDLTFDVDDPVKRDEPTSSELSLEPMESSSSDGDVLDFDLEFSDDEAGGEEDPEEDFSATVYSLRGGGSSVGKGA